MTQGLRSAIIAGTVQQTIYGRVDYEDIFGFSHWLTFCQHTEQGGEWEACGIEYNQADKNIE